MPNDHHKPITKAEHRAAYEEHKAEARRLFAVLHCLREVTSLEFRRVNDTYHDELAAMSWHYTAAMLAEELGE